MKKKIKNSGIGSAAIVKKLKTVREAARELRGAGRSRKNAVLYRAAELLSAREGEILRANAKDVKELAVGTKNAFVDRLVLNRERIKHMAESLRQVALLDDPVGQVADEKTLPNGLKLKRVRSPLGVILMIFESRPNVCIEAFSLAFKAGNAIILRGGRESMRTTKILYGILHEALRSQNFSSHCLWGITDANRQIVNFLLTQKNLIDVAVPRGGEGLINFVVEHSKIPIIKNDRGLCHVYVHEDADLKMALEIIENGKMQRPGVCNSVETILIHEKIASQFLPQILKRLTARPRDQVEWFVDQPALKILKTSKILNGADGQAEKSKIDKKFKPIGSASTSPSLLKFVKKISKRSYDTEYLDFKINARVVKSLEQALEHIERHGSRHSEAIITASEKIATVFQATVDAAAVYHNASTRFTDGFEMGLGGELGISTQKLHVRGPVGLSELTSLRWVATGTGQVRQ